MAEAVEVQRVIGADPDTLWSMVSDVTRMGEWSPETSSCRWLGDATGPEVGARFLGNNRLGWHRWTTMCRVTAADPGQRFAFDADLALAVANWAYTFEQVEGGTLVTETWTDRRGWLFRKFGWVAHGVRDRAPHNAASMERTLARLAEVAEAS